MFRRTVQIIVFVFFSFLFLHVCCPYPTQPGSEQKGFPSHYADRLAEKERFVQAETFLRLDPSVALASAISGRFVFFGLLGALAVFVFCLVIPRGFCGYLCPLGTLLDFFDILLSPFRNPLGSAGILPASRSEKARQAGSLRTQDLKYVSLAALGIAALFGISLVGYIAPIPVLTRFFIVVFSPFQTAFYRGWYQVPVLNTGEILSVILFLMIVLLGLIHRRFWCRNLCPTGALLSLVSRGSIFGRKINPEKCNHCSRCVNVCDFGAIERKGETHISSACATCLKCETVCGNQAVTFGFRLRNHQNMVSPEPRRRFLFGNISLALAGFFTALTLYSRDRHSWSFGKNETDIPPIRPPGSVPEMDFLKRCVRCGECLRACPNNALQPCDWDWHGDRLWTPQLVPDWSGCEPSCNNCDFVCPTGAGFDERLEIDPDNLTLLYQGVLDKDTSGKPYGQIPWKLGVLRPSEYKD